MWIFNVYRWIFKVFWKSTVSSAILGENVEQNYTTEDLIRTWYIVQTCVTKDELLVNRHKTDLHSASHKASFAEKKSSLQTGPWSVQPFLHTEAEWSRVPVRLTIDSDRVMYSIRPNDWHIRTQCAELYCHLPCPQAGIEEQPLDTEVSCDISRMSSCRISSCGPTAASSTGSGDDRWVEPSVVINLG